MTNFNERTNIRLYKNLYISHFILERVDVSCVWEVSWRRGQTATYWPKVLLTIAALLSHSGWAAQPWVTEGPKPSYLPLALTLASCPQLTQAVCVLVIFLFDIHLLPLIYTGASLDWRLCRGSIRNTHVYPIYEFKKNMILRACRTFISIFHMVCISQRAKIWWQTSVQARSTLFDFPPFWIASKQIVKRDWNKFSLNLKKYRVYIHG